MSTQVLDLMSQYTNQSAMSSYFTDKMEVISVLSYASGKTISDGATDATTAITSALAAGDNSKMNVLYIPGGT